MVLIKPERRSMDNRSILKAYRRYAPRYDLYFGHILAPGRREAVRRMNCLPGDQVLEVGVGTGLSLPLYRRDAVITGIDLSPEMLEWARVVRMREGLKNIDDLLEMDAEAMTFADNTFDKVVAMYVASVVQDPVKLVDEMRRVCRPDGEIFIVNHFQQTTGIMSYFEKLVSPLAGFLGFDPVFNFDSFVNRTNLDVVESIPVNCLGYWTMLRARNNKVIPEEASENTEKFTASPVEVPRASAAGSC